MIINKVPLSIHLSNANANASTCYSTKAMLSSLQYAILLTMVLTTFIKYMLHTIDLQSENPWDNKAVYMLYTELFTGMTVLPVSLFYTHV